YRITLAEAEDLLARELVHRGMGEELQVNVIGRRSEDLVRRTEPVVMDVVDMQVDESQGRFAATVLFSTEAELNKPGQKLGQLLLSGRFEEMLDVPVVKYRLSADDVIREEDLEWQKLPASRTRRDTIQDMAKLVGKSPVRTLSPNRPVRTSEIQDTPIVHKMALVQMDYQTENLQIQAVGTALQDGAMGDKIRVRNDDSGRELDAVVEARGKVRVIPALALN
ncbi:MAG: flagellar basal body P-ring formation chaperone FlgA, partial [Rickettsiales bacterium]